MQHYSTQPLVQLMAWARAQEWVPPPPVAQALDEEEGADAIVTLEPETWEELLQSAILWGRGKQKKLL